MSDNRSPYCSTCGLPFDVHPGLLQTCARLAVALRVLKEIGALPKNKEARKRAREAVEFIENHHSNPGLQKPS